MVKYSSPQEVKIDVGYEGSIAVKQMLDEDEKRMANIPLQDLLDKEKGRYKLLQDDGVLSFWGLESLKERQDIENKPYDKLIDSNGIYQTERVIFPDLTTGITMMKLTNQPYNDGGDEISYFGDQAFNADGSLLVWQRSSKPSFWAPQLQPPDDKYGQLVMDGDGTRPRLMFKEAIISYPICHPVNPNLAYSYEGSNLVELDLRLGKVIRTVATNFPRWYLKLSPDGKYACGCGWEGRKIVVASLTEEKQWIVPLGGNIHDSYCFVPGNTDCVMFWYEGKFYSEGFVVANFKTGKVENFMIKFDWNHGDTGRFFGAYTNGDIYPFKNGSWKPSIGNVCWPTKTFQDLEPYYDIPSDYNGYLVLSPDDNLWVFPTRIVNRPYLSEIECFFAKPSPLGGRGNRFRVCLTNVYRKSDRKGNESVVLDRPNISHDGTKILFNSNVFGKAEVYMAIVRKPLPPVGLKATSTSDGIKLTWKEPRYHQEIKGYHIYRSNESGKGFEIINDSPIEALEYLDKTAKKEGIYFYALRSVEHSKLESELSEEISVNLNNLTPLRIFVEAEKAISSDLEADPPTAIWMNIDGFASNLYYIWQRDKFKPGSVFVEVDIPREDDYFVYARVKGKEGVKFNIAKQDIICDSTEEWRWEKSKTVVRLKAGKQRINITSTKYGSCLDCFYLSTDGSFIPKGRIKTTLPEKLTLSVQMDEKYPCLSWNASKDKRFYYYNVYCSTKPNFNPSRKTLIGSPDSTKFLDWQAISGRKYYKVTQVTLDGIESEPSNEIEINDYKVGGEK